MSTPPVPPHPSLATLLRSGEPAAGPGPGPATGDTADAEDRMPPVVAAVDTGAATAPVTGGASPSFLHAARHARPAARRTPRWQWLLLAALALLLAVQVVVADRATLAARAGTRPLVAGLCAVLRCSLPPWHQPDAFTMLQRDIRPLPGTEGVLQVQASFRNDARWAQAWPQLRLSLADADGRVTGRRLLSPDDYLGGAHDPQQRLAPGQSAQVAFLLREPAATTVAYTFEFR
ncbi:DUF3426 domain-containing protein [Stenotrophomonas mori]|uniref:DUF3426 domain-containing protein n=1 Tax=Stenotrophomonas mori TaxID=2871096 RepID=A0ABT0SGR9_9GAMM|nr:DUF3426 domain-containing protein [Stenotrophomonas mori]MCL7714524.1 DUF3426 domain-containing protein [Stenotrophomonas mori]